MDGAFGGDGNTGEPARQTLADFASAPAGMLTLHIQNVVLDLKRKLVSVTIGTSASVREPVNPAFLVTIEDLVAGFARKRYAEKCRECILCEQSEHQSIKKLPVPALPNPVERLFLPHHRSN